MASFSFHFSFFGSLSRKFVSLLVGRACLPHYRVFFGTVSHTLGFLPQSSCFVFFLFCLSFKIAGALSCCVTVGRRLSASLGHLFVNFGVIGKIQSCGLFAVELVNLPLSYCFRTCRRSSFRSGLIRFGRISSRYRFSRCCRPRCGIFDSFGLTKLLSRYRRSAS